MGDLTLDQIRRTAEFAEFVAQGPSVREFWAAVMVWLQREVGYDTGYVASTVGTTRDSQGGVIGHDGEGLRASIGRCLSEITVQELGAYMNRARRHSDIWGPSRRGQMFVFREILKPHEVKHVAVRSSMRNGMLLGFNLERRSGPPFNDRELALIDAVAPLVQLGDAMARLTAPQSSRDPVEVWADEQGLSRREREIAVFASRGMSNAEIAVLLNISVFTVRNTLVRVFGKAGISRRSELSFEALQGKPPGGSDRQRSQDLLSLFYRTARQASSQPPLIAAPASPLAPGVILPLM